MRIGLDVRMIHNSGIGTTVRGLLDHITSEQRDQMILYGHSKTSNYSGTYRVVPYPIYGLRQHWSYGRYLNRQGLSLFHMPHYDVPLSYKGPLVVTVHDLIHYLFPHYSTKPMTRVYSRFLLGHVARRAARILVDSENTGRDLAKYFPKAADKIRVVYLAVDSLFKPVPTPILQSVLTKYGLASGYLLYLGNLRESKNTKGLIQAYRKALRTVSDLPPLVLAGKNSLKNFDVQQFSPSVRCLNEVALDDLPALYTGASMFVFPTFYEGFGLPPLEAMACGTPVIASRVASLPEVCGDAAEYVNPNSEDSIAEAIVKLHQRSSWRDKLRQKGFDQVKHFSWRKFANETWQIYQDVIREQAK